MRRHAGCWDSKCWLYVGAEMRRASRFVLLLCLVFMARFASGQTLASGSIAGVVRDTSGAVLPGVSVEAASSALIEKVRSVVTDGQGQYKIVNLPLGTYSVTVSLPGFKSVQRASSDEDGEPLKQRLLI